MTNPLPPSIQTPPAGKPPKLANMNPVVEAKNLLAVIVLLVAPTTFRCLEAAAIPGKDHQQPTMPAITLAGCPDKCGSVSIPYPFGTKTGCFIPGFEVVCNDTFDPPRPFLANPALDKTKPVLWTRDDKCSATSSGCLSETSMSLAELIDMSPEKGKARVYAAFSFTCNNTTSRTGSWSRQQLINVGPSYSSPFAIAEASNVLLGIGRAIEADLSAAWPGTTYGAYVASCKSLVTPPAVPTNGSCGGMGCCLGNDMPYQYLECSWVKLQTLPLTITGQKASPCSYGMMVERSWYNFSVSDLDDDEVFLRNNPKGVPVVLDFAIKTSGSCPAAGQPVPAGYACISGNSSCVDATNGGPGYICKCWDGYDGNPYIPHGCQGTYVTATN